jgi:flagellar hook assembly protein FlgD
MNTTDNVSVKVYDVFGKEISTLVDSKLIPGEHTFYWFGTNADGNTVSEGVYYYTISTSTQKITKPMIFIGQ